MKIQVSIPTLILIISAYAKPASGESNAIPEDVREFVSGAVMLSCTSQIKSITLTSTGSSFETVALNDTERHEVYHLEIDLQSPSHHLRALGRASVERTSNQRGESSTLKMSSWNMPIEMCNVTPSILSLRCGDHWTEFFVDIDSAFGWTTVYWTGGGAPAAKEMKSDVRFAMDFHHEPMIRVKFAEAVDGFWYLVLLKNRDSRWSANYSVDGKGPFEFGITCY